MPRKRPSDLSPEQWREYLRRFPRMAWWLRQVDREHPDYPGIANQGSHDANDSSAQGRLPPSPPRRSFLASLTSTRSHLHPPFPPPFGLRPRHRVPPQFPSLRETPASPPGSAPSRSQGQSDVRPTTSQTSRPPSQCTHMITLFGCGQTLNLDYSELNEQQ